MREAKTNNRTMCDFFGNPISVGDTVAFIQLKYRNLLIGTVVEKLGTKTLLIAHDRTNLGDTKTKQVCDQVIVKPKDAGKQTI